MKISSFWVSVFFLINFFCLCLHVYNVCDHPLFPSPSTSSGPSSLHPYPLFSCVHGWNLFYLIFSLCTYDFFLCFFLENEEHYPCAASAEADVMRFPRRDNKDQQLSCKFISSVFYISCVFNFMLCVTPLPFSPPPPPPPPPPSLFLVFMDESCLNYYWAFVLNISVVAFSEECKTLPCAVSVKEDARRFFFFRRDDEDHQLLGKCGLPYWYLLF